MKILGISHDLIICSAALVVDGEVVAAVAEERLDREKRSRVFPVLAIDECLRLGGITLDDIDEIAVAWNPAIDAESTLSGWLSGRRWRAEHLMQVPSRFLKISGRTAGQTMSHTNLWEGAPPITYVEHYLAHVGNAFYLSPYDEAAVLVVDGRGETKTGLLGRMRGTDLEVLEEVHFPHSIGMFYGAVTQFLGFRPDADEWKVMALGSYANAENEYTDAMRSLVRVDDRGRFTVALDAFSYYNVWARSFFDVETFEGLFGPSRHRDDPIEPRHQQVAAAAQLVFEEAMAAILVRLAERTGLDTVVGSGGCLMNSVFNGKITRLSPFRSCWISSCPDDSGVSVGAALWLHGERTGQRPPVPRETHNFWGTEYSDAECLSVATRYKLPNAQQVEDPSTAAADDLVAGRLVGWFQGRAEFGQRALGHRSILADPRDAATKDVINAAVKFRESFRPFAPAILAERVGDWFECEPGEVVPFMEKVLPFKAEKQAEVAAVVHADGSGRLQTVGPDGSPRYRALIEAFEERTGVPIVLNTSFNLNGEPMVHAPEDAIRTFYSCGLDVLYLGNVRISKVD